VLRARTREKRRLSGVLLGPVAVAAEDLAPLLRLERDLRGGPALGARDREAGSLGAGRTRRAALRVGRAGTTFAAAGGAAVLAGGAATICRRAAAIGRGAATIVGATGTATEAAGRHARARAATETGTAARAAISRGGAAITAERRRAVLAAAGAAGPAIAVGGRSVLAAAPGAAIAAVGRSTVLAAAARPLIAGKRRRSVLAPAAAGALSGAVAALPRPVAVRRTRVAEPGGAVLAAATAARTPRPPRIRHGGAVAVHVPAELAALRRSVLPALRGLLCAPRAAAVGAALRRIQALAREAVGLGRREHEGGAALGTGDVLVLMVFHGCLETVGVAVLRCLVGGGDGFGGEARRAGEGACERTASRPGGGGRRCPRSSGAFLEEGQRAKNARRVK